jgi:translation initiation factor 3 subunit M
VCDFVYFIYTAFIDSIPPLVAFGIPHCTPFLPFLVTEIKGLFNLLYAHLLTLWLIDSPEIKIACVQPPSHHHILDLDLRVYGQVSHVSFPPLSLSTKPSSSLHVQTMNCMYSVLQVSRSGVEDKLTEWDITPTENCAFLKTLL